MTVMSRKLYLIIPCFNEARRINIDKYSSILELELLNLIFVNDASTDETLVLINKIQQKYPNQVKIISHSNNLGKSEAIRTGINSIINTGDDFAFMDADLSICKTEIIRSIKIFQECKTNILFSSRSQLSRLEQGRSLWRYILSKAYLYYSKTVFKHSLSDIQCGLKFFQNSESMPHIFKTPFTARWLFEIELLYRLKILNLSHSEFHLLHWSDVQNSKITFKEYIRIIKEIIFLTKTYSLFYATFKR